MRNLGWFGWTLLTVLFVTIIGSAVIFFNLFNLDIDDITNRQAATENEEASEEKQHEIEEIQETVGREHRDIGEFIAIQHEFYNQTTGYGGISNLDWEEQADTAAAIIDYIDAHIDSVESGALRNDLNAIRELTAHVLEEQSPAFVRDLHRYFHDLDIALNSYDGYDRIWNVTETLSHID